MPLKKGSSRKAISRNVKEMVDSWKSKGKIGNSRPRSKKKAVKQAVAISLKKAGKSKYQSKKKVAKSKKSNHTRRSSRKSHGGHGHSAAVYSKMINL